MSIGLGLDNRLISWYLDGMTAKRIDADKSTARKVPPLRRTDELSRFGSKGGKAAASRMTAKERRARALKAVAAREAKRNP